MLRYKLKIFDYHLLKCNNVNPSNKITLSKYVKTLVYVRGAFDFLRLGTLFLLYHFRFPKRFDKRFEKPFCNFWKTFNFRVVLDNYLISSKFDSAFSCF